MLVLTGAVGLAVGSPALAGAEPDSVLCQYALSDPHVVDVSGTKMVTATVTPGECTGDVKPISTQVCVTTGASAGRCAELPGYGTAYVYFSPYTPGLTYTARGRGCASQARPPQTICSSVGPTSATL